jgi:outer membrane biosynthesis protein TonB
LQADELLANYAVNIEKKLSRIAQIIPPQQPIVGAVGAEQIIFVELDKNGSVLNIRIAGPVANSELKNAALRLIQLAAPFSIIPSPTVNEFLIIRLSVSVLLNDSRAISIKEVRAVGGYKYVEF